MFDQLTNTVFDWRSHLEGTPCLRDLPLQQQRDMLAAYLQEHPAELYEILDYLRESEAITVAMMINGTIDSDGRREFDDALFNAAVAALALVVDDRIALLYDDYVREYGVFSLADDSGPSELIGWR